MRAMTLKAPASLDTLTPATLPDIGAPGPGEIAVRLRASSLNFHDYAVCAGRFPTADGRIPLSDGAGEVLATGAGVREFAAGDAVVSTFFPDWLDGPADFAGMARVPGDGLDGYAREAVIMPATAFTRAPAGYSPAEAATLTTAGLTAWRALVPNGPLMPGQWVLVQGTGGVSIFALQFARAMGARVIATSSSDAKLERLKALGAEHAINYRSDANWGATAARLSGGGVDHVIEVGGPDTLLQSLLATRPCGHVSVIGILSGYEAKLPVPLLLTKQIRLHGITVGTRRQQQEMIRAIEATCIRPVIDRSFPLEELAAAFRHQESGAHFGKICIEM